MPSEVPSIFCDTELSVGTHNSVARIAFIRLDADGKAIPALELFLPVSQIAGLAKALYATAPPK